MIKTGTSKKNISVKEKYVLHTKDVGLPIMMLMWRAT